MKQRRRQHTYSLCFEGRLELIITALEMRYEERDGFISDDDVLDACQAWTLTPYGSPDDDDYRELVDEIFDCLNSD